MKIERYKHKIRIQYRYVKNLISCVFGDVKETIDSKKKYAFIFCAADYNNLGDIAITLAQEKFLKQVLGESYSIIKISVDDVYPWVKAIKRLPKENVLVTFIGGGNNGSLYEFIEEPRRFVFRILKKYNIISFPQSVVFESLQRTIPYKEEFIKICEKCDNLHLFAREEASYIEYKRMVSKNVWLCPDIVFSLKECRNIVRNNTLGLIMRSDKEKALDPLLQGKLLSRAITMFENVEYMDTCDIILQDEYNKVLNEYFDKLCKCKMVITDRLHGMIFCYCTSTPCIAMGIKNPKIESTFNTWLTEQNYIKFFEPNEGLEKFIELITELSNLKEKKDPDMNEFYDNLKKVCTSCMK